MLRAQQADVGGGGVLDPAHARRVAPRVVERAAGGTGADDRPRDGHARLAQQPIDGRQQQDALRLVEASDENEPERRAHPRGGLASNVSDRNAVRQPEYRIAAVRQANNLPLEFEDCVQWDILHYCMEHEYCDMLPPGTYRGLAYWYLRGRFPCGDARVH